MYLKFIGGMLLAMAGVCAATAQVNYCECQDLGYITETFRTEAGLVAVSNKGTEIFLVDGDNDMKSLVASPGAGKYVSVSKDGRYVGFKSINSDGEQAPALLEVATGEVILLDKYTAQCGQVSFADDGTIAYPYGNSLIVRMNGATMSYDLGGVMNIVNLNPAGTEAAYATIDGDMFILDLATGAKKALGDLQGYRPYWSPDGTRLAIQTVNGGLLSYDKASNRVYELGAATSVSWAGNDDLVITRPERENDLVVKGASVMKISFDGKDAETLVALSEGTPVSATLEGKKLLVSYANGAERGITETTFTGDVRRGAPARVKRLARFAEGQRVGQYVANNFGGCERPSVETLGEKGLKEYARKFAEGRRGRIKAPLKANGIGLTAIPYINQVWDTPAIDGSEAYGYVCSASVSSCMMLAWYGKFEGMEKWTPSRSDLNPFGGTMYSRFVFEEYTSRTGFVFNISANGGSGGMACGIKGAYGYMWNGGSSNVKIADFHKNNGVKDSWLESGWSVLTRECINNRPYVICLANGTGGHVVTVFRCNQVARKDGSGTYAKNGSFVCHDPYGDYNAEAYPNWDGRYASYDWPGYNNGQANIGAFYWGCVTVDESPYTANVTTVPDGLGMECGSGNTDFMSQGYRESKIVVTPENVTGNITAKITADPDSEMSVTPAVLGPEGGIFTVRYTPKVKRTSDYVYPLLTISTENSLPVTVGFKCTWDGTATNSGVKDIETDYVGKDVWYNLQGVRVDKPTNGLYIRSRNGRSSKVFVR